MSQDNSWSRRNSKRRQRVVVTPGGVRSVSGLDGAAFPVPHVHLRVVLSQSFLPTSGIGYAVFTPIDGAFSKVVEALSPASPKPTRNRAACSTPTKKHQTARLG